VNVDLGIWTKLTRVAVFLLFIAGLLLVSVWYLPLIERNERMRKEILRLDNQIQREEEKGRQIKAAHEALRKDPKTIERLARERLGFVKPGETVFRFEEPATNSTPHR
jgi:cell division protein FtsB